jgi:hypothetical protein
MSAEIAHNNPVAKIVTIGAVRMRLLLSNLTILSLRAELIFCDAAQRDCRKNLSSKNVQKNLPQQAQKLSKCCAEHQKQGAF